MSILAEIRNSLASQISRRLIPKNICILSDDCWGGQLYRQLHLPYTTPTVGLIIIPRDYLRYVETYDDIHREELVFTETKHNYPVATLAGIEIHFMHYHSEEEARSKYWRRYERSKRCKRLVKIDFGKSGEYTRSNIIRWNQLRLPYSLALYPPSIQVPEEGIYNGVMMNDWHKGGARMFNLSRKHFNVFRWTRQGEPQTDFFYRFLNTLLFDPTAPRRIVNQTFHLTS